MIQQIINKLFCLHDWITFKTIKKEILNPYISKTNNTTLILTCKKCGKLKIYNL